MDKDRDLAQDDEEFNPYKDRNFIDQEEFERLGLDKEDDVIGVVEDPIDRDSDEGINLNPGYDAKFKRVNDALLKERQMRYAGGKYTAKTQPRDARGRFRQVLARLKVDLGDIGSSRALDKIQEIENLDYAGNYARATQATADLIGIIDRLDTKALNPKAIRNVRESSRELGRVMANLPFAFGEQAEKVRYSDLPPALRDLIDDMIKKVEAKIGKEDADIATRDLKSFMSGSDLYSQSDISSQMAKMLRLLT